MPTVQHSTLIDGLQRPLKVVPTSYLYDARGSAIYDEITRLDEYYPFLEERRLLKLHAPEIAAHVPADSVVVELGCGNALKTRVLLQAIAKRHGRCRFAGIDVSQAFLLEAERNILATVPQMRASDLDMICADYLDGARIARKKHPDATLCLLWLGSSVGNLTDDGIVSFFQSLQSITGPNMQLLLCTDLWKDRHVLHSAYDDPHGVTERFIKNGARNAFQALGLAGEQLEEAAWTYEVVVNSDLRRVEMWLQFPDGVKLLGGRVSISPGERVLMEISRKFTPQDVAMLGSKAGMVVQAAWGSPLYGIQLLTPMHASLLASWRDADAFFAGLPDWFERPIEFRHPFCFYYGHLAAFAILKLLPARPPSPLDVIFSRGIDPLLLDPSSCHAHPDVPNTWPSRPEIEAYVQATRGEIEEAMRGTESSISARQVSLAVEHDRMHIETLSYMRMQTDKTELIARPMPITSPSPTNDDLLFPSAIARDPTSIHPNSPHILGSPHPRTGPPPPPHLSSSPSSSPTSSPLRSPLPGRLDVLIPAGRVTMGTDVTGRSDGFVWDNEGPPTVAVVPRDFLVSSAPVSVSQFHSFVTELKGYQRPELWEPEDWAFLGKHGITCPASWSLVRARRRSGMGMTMDGEGSSSDGEGEDLSAAATAGAGSAAAEGGKRDAVGAEEDEREYWVHVHLGLGKGTVARPWYKLMHQPVWVSLAEAQAFCRASGSEYRVMSEAEWHQIVAQPVPFVLPAHIMKFDDGESVPGAAAGGVDGGMGVKGGDSNNQAPPTLVLDSSNLVVGSKGSTERSGSGKAGEMSSEALRLAALQKSVREGGWEWTSYPFVPFPGFVKMEEYPEYSSDFFDEWHFVLKGKSPVTHESMVRDSFRNYYQRQYPFVFAKFRCCKDVAQSIA